MICYFNFILNNYFEVLHNFYNLECVMVILVSYDNFFKKIFYLICMNS